MQTYTWRPEVSIRCLPEGFAAFGTRSFIDPNSQLQLDMLARKFQSLAQQQWCYRHVPPGQEFFKGVGDPNSGS